MIKANFNAYASYVTDSLYQWDLNQELTVSGLNLEVAPEVHFANKAMDKAIVRQATLTDHVVNVSIPNSLLQYPLTIHAYIGIYEGSTFKVIERVDIPVIPKERPADYRLETSDEEVYSFEALRNEIVNLVKELEKFVTKGEFTEEQKAVAAEFTKMVTYFEYSDQVMALLNLIGVNTDRINNIIAHNNDTEGNTELIDIRVGPNGQIYNTAGDAVRDQYKKSSNELRRKYVDTPNLINRHTITVGLLNPDTGKISSGDETFDQFVTTDFINVIPGKTYEIFTQFPSGYTRVVYFGETAPYSYESSGEKSFTITIPSDVYSIRASFLNRDSNNPSKYSVEYPAFFSIVNYGDDVKSPMVGVMSREYVEDPVNVSENGLVKSEKIAGLTRLGNNLFNKYETVDNKFLNANMNWLDNSPFNEYFTSDFISVNPGETYTLSPIWSVLYFNKYRIIIGQSNEVGNKSLTVTVPDNCTHIRFQALMSNKESVMMNKGDKLLSYEPYRAAFGFMPEIKPTRIYTLKNALSKWFNGKKFPIGFLGDSTTDGSGTTSGGKHMSQDSAADGWGTVDYINTDAYPYKLEKLLQGATDNANLRIYNIGYAGFSFKSIIPHYDEIFNGVYSDVKMVGINFGINDRLTTDPEAYYSEFRKNLIYTVEYLYSKGIQPFIVTSQATLEPFCEDNLDAVYPMRDSESINTIANGIKKEIAEEYGLEILDLNSYGEFMINYSQISVSDICTDNLHFKDAGHTFESEYLYSVICGRCVNVKIGDLLSYSSQKMKSKCPTNYLRRYAETTNGFKVYMQYDREEMTDITLQDFVICVDEKNPVTLVAHCETPNTQYVLVDDVSYPVTETVQEILTLDVGVHRIKAMSGNSTNINWVGFKIG